MCASTCSNTTRRLSIMEHSETKKCHLWREKEFLYKEEHAGIMSGSKMPQQTSHSISRGSAWEAWHGSSEWGER